MTLPRPFALVLSFSLAGPLAAAAAGPMAPEGAAPPVRRDAEVRPAARMADSPPLWLLKQREVSAPEREDSSPGEIPRPAPRPGAPLDGALQPPLLAPAAAAGIKLGANFLGIGVGVPDYRIVGTPPDTNGAVGPTHFVQTVNSDFAIYDKKTGALLFGPQNLGTLFQGLGGNCEVDNDGDPVVLYDQFADRWVISQFAVSNPLIAAADPAAWYECVAVSKSGDPRGGYYLYAFDYDQFNDYPKMGLWPDGYYATFNLFGESARSNWFGGEVCAYDRVKMLAGQPATQQCFKTGPSYGGLLASSADGKTLPKTGAPNQVIAIGSNPSELATWRFHVDWVHPQGTTFTGPAVLKTAPFQEPCPGVSRQACIEQQGGVGLSTLGDRLMNRYAYRNFGGHESLVVNHTVNVSGASTRNGVRWYELRLDANGTPQIFQQGTYSPDGAHRWTASAAMDQAGNLALGYSISSATTRPGLRVTGRLASDALGLLPLPEAVVFDGSGAQTGLNRWGDYSSNTVDPVDDCTFYFTSEYLTTLGFANWSTRVVAYTLPNCPVGSDGPDFALQFTPTSTTIGRGVTTRSTLLGTALADAQTAVALSVAGLPDGLSASLSAPSLLPGQTTSDLLLTSTTSSPVGRYDVVVTGTSASGLAHAAVAHVEVQANDFTIAAPLTVKVAGGRASYSVTTAVTGGAPEAIALSASGLPAGFTAAFSPATITGAGQSTLTLTAPASAPALKASFNITGTSPSATRSAAVEVVVPNEWALPAAISGTVTQGQQLKLDLKTVLVSGDPEAITLAARSLPVGLLPTFAPPQVTAGQTGALLLTAQTTAITGTFTFLIQASSASQTHQVNATITVVQASGCGSAGGGGLAALLGLLALLRSRARRVRSGVTGD